MKHTFDHNRAIGKIKIRISNNLCVCVLFSWDRTPADDAITFGRTECMKIIKEAIMRATDQNNDATGNHQEAPSMGIWPKQFYKRSFSDDDEVKVDESDEENRLVHRRNDSSSSSIESLTVDGGQMAMTNNRFAVDSGVDESVVDSREMTTIIE